MVNELSSIVSYHYDDFLVSCYLENPSDNRTIMFIEYCKGH